MARSVSTNAQTGLRYYSKLTTLELGASDRLDTALSKSVQGSWPGSALVINSDDSNKVDPKLLNSVYMGDDNTISTTVLLTNSVVATEGSQITASTGTLTGSVLSAYGEYMTAPVDNSIITGQSNTITHPQSAVFLSGFEIAAMDTARYSTVAGAVNQYGGLAQLLVGQYLVNRTPGGAVFGNTNVNFTTLPTTGTQGVTAPGMAGYPLLALGNSGNSSGTVPSNAITVLYNGRTQINTAGYSGTLTQTAATPKAALEVVSTNTGVLLPKLTTAQESIIASGDLYSGLLLYNSDAGSFQFYNGSAWVPMGAPGGITAEWDNTGNTATSPSTNFLGTIDSEGLVFRTNDTVRLTIMAGGIVGIGTSTPQANARLSVYGTIYAQKIEATQTGWPDYVFNKDYPLMSLPSVERYTRLHRRLPGMPSAVDVAKKGIDLGDNQAALLKKIEELTLYLIDVHHQSEDRQRKIEQLRARNKALAGEAAELDALKEKLQKLTAKAKQK